MEPKKNPKADLKQWSGVYFLAGLAFMLFLSWQAVEWKSYDRDLSLDTLNVCDDLDEDSWDKFGDTLSFSFVDSAIVDSAIVDVSFAILLEMYVCANLCIC